MPRAKNKEERDQRDRSIANDRLSGVSFNDLAKKYHLSTNTVSSILNKDEMRQIVDTGTSFLVQYVPKAIDNYIEFLSSDDKRIRLKTTENLLQAVGILPSHTQSQVIYNIYNQTNHVYSDRVIEIVDKYTDDMAVMDVEFEVNDCGKAQSATSGLPEPQGKLSGNSAHTSKMEDG